MTLKHQVDFLRVKSEYLQQGYQRQSPLVWHIEHRLKNSLEP